MDNAMTSINWLRFIFKPTEFPKNGQIREFLFEKSIQFNSKTRKPVRISEELPK